MSKESSNSRRENSLTIRFLAQTLINDIIFPDQKGIRLLLGKAKNGFGKPLTLEEKEKIEYFFLFHMEDFGSGDKSEIDLLLRQKSTLFMIEVKAFTNPNDTDVKREIVRNYITLENLVRDRRYFDPVTEIIPILLYSIGQHQKSNPSDKGFNYFNSKYLLKKGLQQKDDMDNWESKSFKVHQRKEYIDEDWKSKLEKINKKLYFLTWNGVRDTLRDLNDSERFNENIKEMEVKVDWYNNRNTKLII